jgi:phosphoribosyl 1,2-cyclic phosphodiesterase
MLVRCWGSRGSVPVSGKEYMKYGGDTTCIEVVSSSGEILIIDAGTGIRKLGNRLQREGVSDINIVLTHPHWDHLSGFPFFKPLYRNNCRINVWGPLTTRESLKGLISKTMSPPHFPIQLKDIQADIRFLGIEESNFRIGPFGIKTITISHPNQGAGYRIEEDGKSFVFLTDNEPAHDHNSGLTTGDYMKFAEGSETTTSTRRRSTCTQGAGDTPCTSTRSSSPWGPASRPSASSTTTRTGMTGGWTNCRRSAGSS